MFLSYITSISQVFQRFAVDAIQNGTGGDTNFPQINANQDTLQTGLQIFFLVLGALTVMYIMYSAIRIVMSQGDPQTIAKERQAIVFAIAGLIIVVSAEVIVTFVLGRISK
jgi:hypothetical protein